MGDYILLRHDDALTEETGDWDVYLRTLKPRGVFEGGSAIGGGVCMRKGSPAPGITTHLVGYVRVTVGTLDEAKSLLVDNPHYQAGGTVEVRELPRTSPL